MNETYSETADRERWNRFAAMAPEEIRAFERDVMRRLCDLSLIPPTIDTAPAARYRNAALPFAQAPGIARTPRGRLWCLWLGSEDGPTSFMVAACSDDQGDTWSDVRMAVDSLSERQPAPRSIRDSCFWMDPRQRLWLFMNQTMNYEDGRDGIWATVCPDPDSDTPHWSAPKRIADGMLLNKPIVLSSGEWMAATGLVEKLDASPQPPVAGKDTCPDAPGGPESGRRADGCYAGPWPNTMIYPGMDEDRPLEKLRKVEGFLSRGIPLMPVNGPIFADLFPELDPYRGVNILVSSDAGTTWQRRATVPSPNPWWHEPMVVERRDGSLWMLVRNETGVVETCSTDQGKTWSPPGLPPKIRHPSSRFHLRRLASGNLLLVKHGATIDAHEGRSQLTAWLSRDDGRSWSGGLMLDERRGVSYPDSTQAPDGTLFIVYDRGRTTCAEILLARLTEQDILAGRLVSPGSRLKVIVRSAER